MTARLAFEHSVNLWNTRTIRSSWFRMLKRANQGVEGMREYLDHNLLKLNALFGDKWQDLPDPVLDQLKELLCPCCHYAQAAMEASMRPLDNPTRGQMLSAMYETADNLHYLLLEHNNYRHPLFALFSPSMMFEVSSERRTADTSQLDETTILIRCLVTLIEFLGLTGTHTCNLIPRTSRSAVSLRPEVAYTVNSSHEQYVIAIPPEVEHMAITTWSRGAYPELGVPHMRILQLGYHMGLLSVHVPTVFRSILLQAQPLAPNPMYLVMPALVPRQRVALDGVEALIREAIIADHRAHRRRRQRHPAPEYRRIILGQSNYRYHDGRIMLVQSIPADARIPAAGTITR